MSQSMTGALAGLRAAMLDDQTLVRAVASGRRRGMAPPPWRRVELRYVDLRAGRHLQVTAYDQALAHTANHATGDAARSALDELLDLPFGNWHVETTVETHQLRVTKKGEAVVHSRAHTAEREIDRDHDRDKSRLLPQGDPVFRALGLADHRGRMKPSRQAKYRQVEEFLRILDASISDALSKGHLRTPTPEEPLQVVDLGCGNAYLTFVAERYLSHVRGLAVHLTGIDQREHSRAHNENLAAELGVDATFLTSSIGEATPGVRPDVVLALHACDTATDDALARAVEWQAPLVLAAPCCHHDIAAQLRRQTTPTPYSMLTRDGILRERFADTLTDALRASLLRGHGYRVEVMEFVGSEHTPRNTLLRSIRTGSLAATMTARTEYDELVSNWGVTPRLAELLGPC